MQQLPVNVRSEFEGEAMAGRIWSELSKSAAEWNGLGVGRCASGAVLLSGLDGAAQSLHARAGRTLKPEGLPLDDEPADPPRRWLFGRRSR